MSVRKCFMFSPYGKMAVFNFSVTFLHCVIKHLLGFHCQLKLRGAFFATNLLQNIIHLLLKSISDTEINLLLKLSSSLQTKSVAPLQKRALRRVDQKLAARTTPTLNWSCTLCPAELGVRTCYVLFPFINLQTALQLGPAFDEARLSELQRRPALSSPRP